ncbi:major facilitator superfamily domain-containing protein [Aspergillus tetrazonus]
MPPGKNDVESQAITAAPCGRESIHPSTDISERTLSKIEPADNSPAVGDLADNEPVNVDPEQAQPPACTAVEPPAYGGYGWSYGVFLALYLDTNTFPGASDLDFAFVGGLSLSMAQFIAPVATITTRKWWTRTTLVIGIILQSAALFGASWSTEIWQLFLSQAICFGFGMGMHFSAIVGIIPQWFSRRRSLANGIGTAGSGIGGLIYSLASGAIIQRWAVACGLSVIIIRDRNKAIGAVQIAFHATFLKRPDIMGYVVCLFSIPSYANTVGLTSSQGSILGAMFNLGGGLGRPVIGYVTGLFSLVIWIFAKSFGVLIFYALVGGTVSATYTTTVAPVGAKVVGSQLLPSALSIFWLSVVIPSTFAEPIFTGFMFMGAAISLWLVRTWKISELQKTGAGNDPVEREAIIRDDDAVPQQPVGDRTFSGDLSAASKARTAKGLFMMVKV